MSLNVVKENSIIQENKYVHPPSSVKEREKNAERNFISDFFNRSFQDLTRSKASDASAKNRTLSYVLKALEQLKADAGSKIDPWISTLIKICDNRQYSWADFVVKTALVEKGLSNFNKTCFMGIFQYIHYKKEVEIPMDQVINLKTETSTGNSEQNSEASLEDVAANAQRQKSAKRERDEVQSFDQNPSKKNRFE